MVGVALCMGTARVDRFALGGMRRLPPAADGNGGAGVSDDARSACIATMCTVLFELVFFSHISM